MWNFNNPFGWKNFHANNEQNLSLDKIWLEDVNVQHAPGSMHIENGTISSIGFSINVLRKRMVTVLGSRYNKKKVLKKLLKKEKVLKKLLKKEKVLKKLLKKEKVLKKSLRTIESNKKRKKEAKQLKRLQSYIHEEISNYNFKLVSTKIDNSGTLSKNAFLNLFLLPCA